jgi:hypothetical protein
VGELATRMALIEADRAEPAPSLASSGVGQIHQVPHGSVNAGGGGTAGGGVDPWQLGLGGAAVLAGAGLATTAGLRGRRQ